MASLTGPIYVPQPNPLVRRYGLFDAATGPLDLPMNARIGGIQYQTSVCTLPQGYEIKCQANHDTKTFPGTIPTVTGSPFVVYSAIECGTVGLANWGQDLIRQHLYNQLVSGEQATVERIFSDSTFGLQWGLASNPAAVNLGTAADIVNAVGILESWLYARYGLPGVLHVPILAASYVKAAHLCERDPVTGPWKTVMDTKLSFGNYSAAGPTGQVPGTNDVWIYITGQVAIWRTPDSQLLDIPLGQVINRTTNTVDIVMEREYVITYDCYVAGVQVHLTPV